MLYKKLSRHDGMYAASSAQVPSETYCKNYETVSSDPFPAPFCLSGFPSVWWMRAYSTRRWDFSFLSFSSSISHSLLCILTLHPHFVAFLHLPSLSDFILFSPDLCPPSFSFGFLFHSSLCFCVCASILHHHWNQPSRPKLHIHTAALTSGSQLIYYLLQMSSAIKIHDCATSMFCFVFFSFLLFYFFSSKQKVGGGEGGRKEELVGYGVGSGLFWHWCDGGKGGGTTWRTGGGGGGGEYEEVDE